MWYKQIRKKISDGDKKFLILVGLLKKPSYIGKITEIENKIASISGLAITTTLIAVENKIPVSNLATKINVSNLATKIDYNTKINETDNNTTDCDHDRYISMPELNKRTTENFASRLAQPNTPIPQFFLLLLLLSEMGNRDPSGGVKIETRTFFRYFLEDIYYT